VSVLYRVYNQCVFKVYSEFVVQSILLESVVQRIQRVFCTEYTVSVLYSEYSVL
jgi:protein subunit release factor A